MVSQIIIVIGEHIIGQKKSFPRCLVKKFAFKNNVIRFNAGGTIQRENHKKKIIGFY